MAAHLLNSALLQVGSSARYRWPRIIETLLCNKPKFSNEYDISIHGGALQAVV
jgi:hypothetical protein